MINNRTAPARLMIAACALSLLAVAPAAADTQRYQSRNEDSHPLPTDRVEQKPAEPGYPYYVNCGHARSEGDTPLFGGQPGYSRQLDADGDGLACELDEF